LSLQTSHNTQTTRTVLDHDDIAGLERTIDDAYTIASKRLLDIFFDRYKLLDHLGAMKRYILLVAGDFADILLECTGPRLSKEASKLLRHHLTSDVETAIQGSNASNEPDDIQRRLDARILDPQPGDLGWDVFAMDYKVETPVNAVLDGKAMLEYYKLFAHLWRIRRVHSALKQGWIRVTFNSRRFMRISGMWTLLVSLRDLER
jgi:gamma-tubulin complex component 3